MVIHTCPVPECGVAHEAPAGHQHEPCLACWRDGWRVDALGGVFRDLPRVAPHPADDFVEA